MQKILVSACLLGQATRYDGQAKPVSLNILQRWQQQGRLVIVCPEVDGGLPVPRAPAERRGDIVVTETGQDVTCEFVKGAHMALERVKQHHIRFALLKANSPSCGNTQIYDGHFSGQKVTGKGVTAELLHRHGVQVFNETQVDLLVQAVAALDGDTGDD